MKRLIIDGSNLRSGGGVTHIVEVLNTIKDNEQPFDQVILFSNTKTLSQIRARDWLTKSTHQRLNKGLLHITLWKKQQLDLFLKLENKNHNSILFSPPGTYTGFFKPFIAMSRNMLIFDTQESNRYGFSWMKLKFWILRKEQKKSFKNATSIIFISNYAKKTVQNFLKKDISAAPIINHGVNQKFNFVIKEQHNILAYKDKPFELLYISPLTVYKHQITLIKSVLKLYKEGYNIKLNLVGGAYAPYAKKFETEFQKDKLYAQIINYKGKVPYKTIEDFYKTSEGFIFASTCENMPNILIEAMSSGLPILCSNFQPMPEFLGNDHPFYFDPTDEASVYTNLKLFLEQPENRKKSAIETKLRVKKYTWSDCSKKTFQYLFINLKH